MEFESKKADVLKEAKPTDSGESTDSALQTMRLHEAQGHLKEFVPDIWLLYLIPLFFSVGLISSNICFYLTHLGTATYLPATLNFYLALFSIVTFMLVSFYYESRIKRAAKKLFLQDSSRESIKTARSVTKDEALIASLKRWLGSKPVVSFRSIVPYKKTANLWFVVFLFIVPYIIAGVSRTEASFDVLARILVAGAALSVVIAAKAYLQIRVKQNLETTYLFAAKETKLNVLLRADLKASKDEIIMDFEAFADIQRWLKSRFNQKSWIKTAFIILLVLCFVFFDGLHIMISILSCITSLLTNSVLTSGPSTGSGTNQGASSVHLFSTLISALGFGALCAYVLAICQPTNLQIAADGISFIYKRKPFGKKIKLVAWKDIKELKLIAPKGTTLIGEKELCFEGKSKTLLKFKLNRVDSVTSREKILSGVERFAPSLKRGADVIQMLQRPAEQSYTDLWLQTLAAPPKRDRLKPLVADSVLQDRRYIILRPLGLGGQGTAYLATETNTSQTVVLKEFILPVYVDISVRKSALERFENEARILQKLNHKQIVKLSNFFVEDHRGYLALDYVQGADLKRVIETKGKLSEEVVLMLVLQMCEILQYLHSQIPAVIHRDFTPDNLILQPDGKLILIDFNVAQQTTATMTGTIVGKQCYLPPEQFQGEPIVQSDIYAMGATVYYLVTGKDPEPISQSHPKRIEPWLSDGIDLFVAKCTAIDSELRYQNAQACMFDLNQLKDQQ